MSIDARANGRKEGSAAFVVETSGLTKRFGDRTAVDEIGRASCRERVL